MTEIMNFLLQGKEVLKDEFDKSFLCFEGKVDKTRYRKIWSCSNYSAIEIERKFYFFVYKNWNSQLNNYEKVQLAFSSWNIGAKESERVRSFFSYKHKKENIGVTAAKHVVSVLESVAKKNVETISDFDVCFVYIKDGKDYFLMPSRRHLRKIHTCSGGGCLLCLAISSRAYREARKKVAKQGAPEIPRRTSKVRD